MTTHYPPRRFFGQAQHVDEELVGTVSPLQAKASSRKEPVALSQQELVAWGVKKQRAGAGILRFFLCKDFEISFASRTEVKSAEELGRWCTEAVGFTGSHNQQ